MATPRRLEKDNLGPIEVPLKCFWGAQTQRSVNNFRIGGHLIPLLVIRSFGVLKKACAIANCEMDILGEEKKDLIVLVCDEILNGDLDDHFPLVVWQTGSGDQTNMNVNEVICNRAHAASGGNLMLGKRLLHPVDDVNKSQSTGDAFTVAMKIAATLMLQEKTLPALDRLAAALARKSSDWKNKDGKDMEEGLLTLAEKFSGHATMLELGVAGLKDCLPPLAELPLGCAVEGAGPMAPEGVDSRVAGVIGELTGHKFVSASDMSESSGVHVAFVSSHTALKTIAEGLMKLAGDICKIGFGHRSGPEDLKPRADKSGALDLPLKMDPGQAEALTMVCTRVMGNDVAISIGDADMFRPVVIHSFIESAELLADAADSFNRNFLEDLESDEA